MSILPLVLLYLANQKSGGAKKSAVKAAPKWPTPRTHPTPPRRVPALPPMPPMPHEKAAAKKATPAEHAAAEEHHVETHRAEPHTTAAHKDSATALHNIQQRAPAPAHAAQHVERHARPTVIRTSAPPAVTRLPAHKVKHKRKHKKKRKPTPAAAQTSAASPEPGVVSVANTQKILVKLGWRGDLTTQGALSTALNDGEYGPVTARDWAQSANKRGLDPTYTRLGPNTAGVNPQTYDTLKTVAFGSAAISGIRIP